MARLSAPIWVQVVGGRRGADGEDAAQFGRITLKTCLSAICISRSVPSLSSTCTLTPKSDARLPSQQPRARHRPDEGLLGLGRRPVRVVAPAPSAGQLDVGHGGGVAPGRRARRGQGHAVVDARREEGGDDDGVRQDRRAVGRRGAQAQAQEVRRWERTGRARGRGRGQRRRRARGDARDLASAHRGASARLIFLAPSRSDASHPCSQRDAFTQGQFLDALRSYHHTPIQHLQNEISDFHSSPPKRHDSAVFPPTASAPRPSTSSTGDPIKRKRPRESPVLPLPSAAPSTTSLAAPFATGPAESSPATFPAPLPTLDSAFDTASADLQDPRNAAVLNQLLASLSSSGGVGADGLAGLLPSSLPLDSPQLLPALQTLAKYYGLDLPGQPPAAPSSSSTPFPASADPAPSSAPAPAPAPTSAAASASGSGTTRRRSAKDREHFAAIDLSTLAAPPTNKQNPRDAKGCSNCKRKKSTIWREGTGSDGALTTVCNGASRSSLPPSASRAGALY